MRLNFPERNRFCAVVQLRQEAVAAKDPIKKRDTYEALREEGASKSKAAAIANAQAKSKDSDQRSRARADASRMKKAKLISALRSG